MGRLSGCKSMGVKPARVILYGAEMCLCLVIYSCLLATTYLLLTYLPIVTTGRIPPQRSKVKQLFVRYNSPEVHTYIYTV